MKRAHAAQNREGSAVGSQSQLAHLLTWHVRVIRHQAAGLLPRPFPRGTRERSDVPNPLTIFAGGEKAVAPRAKEHRIDLIAAKCGVWLERRDAHQADTI